MADLRKLILSVAIILMGPALTFSGFAFAEDQGNSYSHQHITVTWDHGLVCGDHLCAPGELPKNPSPVEPVDGH